MRSSWTNETTGISFLERIVRAVAAETSDAPPKALAKKGSAKTARTGPTPAPVLSPTMIRSRTQCRQAFQKWIKAFDKKDQKALTQAYAKTGFVQEYNDRLSIDGSGDICWGGFGACAGNKNRSVGRIGLLWKGVFEASPQYLPAVFPRLGGLRNITMRGCRDEVLRDDLVISSCERVKFVGAGTG